MNFPTEWKNKIHVPNHQPDTQVEDELIREPINQSINPLMCIAVVEGESKLDQKYLGPTGWWLISTPLKNMSPSIGMMKIPIFLEK